MSRPFPPRTTLPEQEASTPLIPPPPNYHGANGRPPAVQPVQPTPPHPHPHGLGIHAGSQQRGGDSQLHDSQTAHHSNVDDDDEAELGQLILAARRIAERLASSRNNSNSDVNPRRNSATHRDRNNNSHVSDSDASTNDVLQHLLVEASGGTTADNDHEILVTVDETQRVKIALITQWTFIALFLGLLLMVIFVAPPWRHQECDLFQTSWSLIWACLMLGHMLLLVSMSHIRWSGRRPPRPLYHLQRSLRSMNTIWFFCGIKPLFWDATCSETCVRVGRSLWWLQAAFFLVPLFCYLLLCLCFPCIIILLQRFRQPSPNETPTPDWIISKLEVHKYEELLEMLRSEFGAQEVEFFPAGHAFTRAVRQNPVVDAITTAASATGMPAPATVAPGLAGTPTEGGTDDEHPERQRPQETSAQQQRLIVEKTCPICMSDFESDDAVMLMPCDKRHFFHVDCVVQWLKNSQFCPICRSNIANLVNPTGQTPSNVNNNNINTNTIPHNSPNRHSHQPSHNHTHHSSQQRLRSTMELSRAPSSPSSPDPTSSLPV